MYVKPPIILRLNVLVSGTRDLHSLYVFRKSVFTRRWTTRLVSGRRLGLYRGEGGGRGGGCSRLDYVVRSDPE